MILPGAVIGILGGGQLGRMMAIAAAQLGYRVHVYTEEAQSPASDVCAQTTVASYSDVAALKRFAQQVDIITFEFENIPYESLEILEAQKPVFPQPHVLRVTRNRLREKSFVQHLGIPVALFRPVTSLEALQEAVEMIGVPAVLKTTEMGYDGKGQVRLRSRNAVTLREAWAGLRTQEAILEGFVRFTMEISVIVARGKDGKSVAFPAVQNLHKHHILHTTTAPAPIPPALAKKADRIAIKIADALNLRGLLAVEMFVTKKGEILVNELAPRPHNSGHWTLDACATSQFEQAIRAVCGLPLGSTKLLCKAVMRNLLGKDVEKVTTLLKNPIAKLHLYGKKEAREGRKMGHVTWLKM